MKRLIQIISMKRMNIFVIVILMFVLPLLSPSASGYIPDPSPSRPTAVSPMLRSDLHYFGARYYHADSTRFLSPDPVGGTPENPLSWNRYLYCRNDPVNMIDPDGKLERHSNGKIKFTRGINIRAIPDNDNRVYVIQRATLKTNNGSPVSASTVRIPFPNTERTGAIINGNTSEMTGLDQTGSNPMATNCHGLTFGDGQFWIQPDQVDTILTGDNYTSVPAGGAQVGDVVIYRDSSGAPVHSATVAAVDDSGNITSVTTLNGTDTEATSQLPGPGTNTAWEPADAKIETYRQK